jgi:hypothetical protein
MISEIVQPPFVSVAIVPLLRGPVKIGLAPKYRPMLLAHKIKIFMFPPCLFEPVSFRFIPSFRAKARQSVRVPNGIRRP